MTESEGQKERPTPTLGLVQEQVPDRRGISNNATLTLSLSRPTGEGTARLRISFVMFDSSFVIQDGRVAVKRERTGARDSHIE